jgi:hypothetical protein
LKLNQNKEIAFGDVNGKNLWFVCIDKEVLEETGYSSFKIHMDGLYLKQLENEEEA